MIILKLASSQTDDGLRLSKFLTLCPHSAMRKTFAKFFARERELLLFQLKLTAEILIHERRVLSGRIGVGNAHLVIIGAV